MTLPATNVAILGSTGSIGRSTLEVIAASRGRLAAVGLSAHASLELLEQQAGAIRPKWIVATDRQRAADWRWSLPAGVELLVGGQKLEEAVARPDVDVLVTAIVGSAGLRSTWAALAAGKRVALANKETLVVAGPLVTQLAAQTGGTIIPVDSEHSAIFQCLRAGRPAEVRRVILTASGGPFRGYTPQQLAGVTADDALRHPTWRMGRKITVDSATLMNKALEIIEARWLFDLAPEQIQVVIHPQSIVHSMVEFVDGSVMAQLSPPDMKLPIQYALTYPDRVDGPASRFDWSRAQQLEFEPADGQQFPALALGMEVAQAGGTAGAVVNAANEAAVAGFLAGEIGFAEIVPACRSILEQHDFEAHPTLERLAGARRLGTPGGFTLGLYLIAFISLSLLGTIVKVAIALGFVIFVHELGHFAVAKLCGVKCEKFYLGFDIGGLKLCKFQWGETEYGIGILPLGGYVKMLGQEDNPNQEAAENERAKVGEPGLETLDPRSYKAQSVPRRMAIISAGVVMNLIFACVFAAIACLMGFKVPAAGVSHVFPGEPAWRADIRPGDQILAINGQISDDGEPLRFRDLTDAVILGDLKDGVEFKIKRDGVDKPFLVNVRPAERSADRLSPTIGVSSPLVTALLETAGSQGNTNRRSRSVCRG